MNVPVPVPLYNVCSTDYFMAAVFSRLFISCLAICSMRFFFHSSTKDVNSINSWRLGPVCVFLVWIPIVNLVFSHGQTKTVFFIVLPYFAFEFHEWNEIAAQKFLRKLCTRDFFGRIFSTLGKMKWHTKWFTHICAAARISCKF